MALIRLRDWREGRIVIGDSSCELASRASDLLQDWYADAWTTRFNLLEGGCYRPKTQSHAAVKMVQAGQKTVKPLEDEESPVQ